MGAKESQTFNFWTLRYLWNGLNLGLSYPQSTWINHVTQVFHLCLEKLAFAWMKFKVMILKSSKYLLHLMLVVLWCRIQDHNVINVTLGKTKSYQHPIHHLMKFCMCILQTKWQKSPLVQTILPMRVNSSKCCLDLVTFLQWQPMVVRSQVQGTSNLGLTKGIKDFFY
jgi:hypothetical protein